MVRFGHAENCNLEVQVDLPGGARAGQKTGKPIQVTRFGVAVADVVPPAPAARSDDWLNAMSDCTRLPEDISELASGDFVQWEADHES